MSEPHEHTQCFPRNFTGFDHVTCARMRILFCCSGERVKLGKLDLFCRNLQCCYDVIAIIIGIAIVIVIVIVIIVIILSLLLSSIVLY